MIEKFTDADHAEKEMMGMLERKEKIMGFGQLPLHDEFCFCFSLAAGFHCVKMKLRNTYILTPVDIPASMKS